VLSISQRITSHGEGVDKAEVASEKTWQIVRDDNSKKFQKFCSKKM